MYIKGRYIVSACALLFFQQAQASGMDCTKAVSVVENAICADKSLYELDVQMGSAYRKLMKATPQAQAELKSAQRQWLKVRDECVDNVSCLNQRYQDRLQMLNVQWIEAVAYKPDDTDKQVMKELQQRIRDMSKGHPEFALERALGSLTTEKGKTSFSGDPNDDPTEDHTLFPKRIPKGVTPDEWKALNASGLDADAEHGQANYTLIDLDGDGQRDLIVSTYTGGTGLFSFYETLRRDGERFTRRLATYDPEASAGSSLFFTNDRGANQSAGWIKSHARMYLAYRDSFYGVDRVYLLNPLKINSQVPTVTVQYDYQLTVPRTQYKEDNKTRYKLEPALLKSLTKALIQSKAGQPQQPSQQKGPLCPIPASGPGDDDYYSYGAGYYVIEPVTDMRVIIGNECFIARLNNWFGSYSEKDGLYAQLTLRKPGSGDPERSYSVNGRRHVTQVSTSIGKAEGGAETF
ncbi:lysozyme inhibitor LprI family protein [Pseudomonas allokribbensis]|uniref:lysozyme inhibitor LprI family protein n=1 Tax=Pseudomonas allokribbensis TaxID=2774460 RepID=UPI001787A3F3|nr:lysozyme inhibitor LprI family protein [Pseudomonas allokribbensis]